MKKKLLSLMLAASCLFTAAVPAFANDANLYLGTYGETQSTGLLQGSSITSFNVHNFGGHEIMYTLTDQNNNELAVGWVQPDSAIFYNGNTRTTETNGMASLFWNSWNMSPAYNTITHINMTITCTGSCDAAGYLDVY